MDHMTPAAMMNRTTTEAKVIPIISSTSKSKIQRFMAINTEYSLLHVREYMNMYTFPFNSLVIYTEQALKAI